MFFFSSFRIEHEEIIIIVVFFKDMACICLFLLIHLPVLTFPKMIVETTCIVDYESFSVVKLSYRFDIRKYNSNSNGNLVNFTRWDFLIDECMPTLTNFFCRPWQPKNFYQICHLNSSNTVECSPLHIKKDEERNFRLVGKFNDTSNTISTEQYTYRSTKCHCRKGFEFNPHLSITADPLKGKMLVRMNPYNDLSMFYIQSFIANITKYLSGRSKIISARTFQMEDKGFYQFEIDDFDVCSIYSVSVKLSTSDCINREMVPDVVKFNLSDTNISGFIESFSCWHTGSLVQVDGIGQEFNLEKFFFKVSTSDTSFNVTGNGTFRIFNIPLKKNTLFSISLCSKECNLCGQNHTVKCSSRIISETAMVFNKQGLEWVIGLTVGLFFLILVVMLMFFGYKWKKLKVMTLFLNSRYSKSRPSSIVQPRLDEQTETTSEVRPRNLRESNTYETIRDYSHYNNDEIDTSRSEEYSEEMSIQLNSVINREGQLPNIESAKHIDFQLNSLALGNHNGNIPTMFQRNTMKI